MDWRYKALAQKAFSRLPGGERLNYLAQRYLTRGLSLTDSYVREVVTTAVNHVRIMRRYGVDLSKATAFEFGAGWFLLKQLLLSLYGCRSQVTVDIRRLARPKLINEGLAKLSECLDAVGPVARSLQPIGTWDDLREHYGISYLAPFDARATGLEARSVDVVSSNDTLEHVPSEEIRALLRESHRILKGNGLAIHYVNYKDHFARFDRSISVYNFLRFSEDEWRRYNSSIHYQNRLRHPEYVRLFVDESFELLEVNCQMAEASELARLRTLRVSPKFAAFALEDLSIQGAWFVLRKG